MKASSFFINTLIAAAAMTSTAWADDEQNLTVAAGETKENISITEGYGAYKVGNDLYVSNADRSTIYVNNTYTDSENDGGHIFGYDAFGGIKEALETAGNGATVLLTGDTVEAAVNWFEQGQITINNSITLDSESKDYVLNYNKGYYVHVADVVDANGNTISEGKLVVTQNVKSEYSGQYRAWSNGEIELYGDIDTYQLWAGRGGKVTIGETADVYMTYGDGMIKIRNGGTIVVNGSLTSTDGELSTMKQQLHGGYISVDYGVDGLDDRLELNNTYVSSAWLVDDSKDGGKFTLAMKNSILELGKLTFNDEAEANISGGSKLLISGAITVGAESTINVANSSVSADSVANAGTIIVSGTSTLDIDTLTGNAVYVKGNTTLTDSTIGGAIYSGYDANVTDSQTLTIAGDSFFAKSLYVGDKYLSGKYVNNEVHGLVIGTAEKGVNNVTIGSLYVRTSADATVTNSNLDIGDLFVRGEMTVTNSTLDYVYGNGGTGHWAIYEDNNSDYTASLTLDKSTVNAKYLVVGSNSNSETPANSNASLSLTNGASLTLTDTLYVQGAKGFNVNVKVEDSTLKAATVYNAGTFNVTGNSTIKFDKLTMAGNTNFVGQSTDAAGTHKVTIGSYTDGATAQITGNGSTRMYFYGADVTLASDVSATMGNGQFFYFQNSELDLNGNTLTLVSGKFLTNNLTIGGSGDIVIGGTVNTDMPCWQGDVNVIGKDVTITSYEQQNFYGNVTIYGTVITDQWSGTNGNGADLVGTTASNFKESVTAKLTISGADARYTILSGPGFAVSTATNTMVVENGALFDMQCGAFDNNGTVEVNNATFKATSIDNTGVITVGKGSTLTANVITGDKDLVKGDVVLAGTIEVVKELSVDVLTIHAGAELKVGVVLRTAVVDSVISANKIVLVVNDLQDGTLDLDTILAEGSSVEGLSNAIQSAEDGVYIKDSGTGMTYSTTFDSDTREITIGAPVPEPSAFGLLAGLGALALVAARRRRK